jgi:predicted heme/steroid binding protein
MNKYTSEELRLRNGVLLPETWVAYKGKIYDVSSSPLFKGGKHYRLYTGQDLTMEMENAPHLEDVLGKFQQIGVLV